MATSKLADILAHSQDVDTRWAKDNHATFLGREIVFTVPNTHNRFKNFRSYKLSCDHISPQLFSGQEIIVIDEKIVNFSWLKDTLPSQQNIIPLSPQESKVKEINFLNTTLSTLKQAPTIVGIGGGIVLNTVGYLAEQLHSRLVYIPATPMAMSDSSTGGKVRVHRINSDTIERNFYKSFYEPDVIIVDPRFLETLQLFHLSYGLAEIVKHALYQSALLLQYLLSAEFSVQNKAALMKAILWTAELKKVCLEIDPEETRDGSYDILRAAHDISDQIEIESKFKVSHGEAVWKAMEKDLLADPKKFPLFLQLKQKLLAT